MFGSVLIDVGRVLAAGMKPPPAVKTMMLRRRDNMGREDVRRLANEIAGVPGVAEMIVIAKEGVAYRMIDPHKIGRQRLDAFSVS